MHPKGGRDQSEEAFELRAARGSGFCDASLSARARVAARTVAVDCGSGVGLIGETALQPATTSEIASMISPRRASRVSATSWLPIYPIRILVLIGDFAGRFVDINPSRCW